jgi:hypothetical protein
VRDRFGAAEPTKPDSPLVGLTVKLPRNCLRCGCSLSRVGAGAGPHLASLHCTQCGTHNGWLPQGAVKFLTDTIERFGRPTGRLSLSAFERHVAGMWSAPLGPDRLRLVI